MKNYAYILSVLTLVFIAAVGIKAEDAPSNDNLSAAMPLVISQGSVGVTTANTNASKEVGEPNHAENPGGRSVWFKFTPTVTKVIRINTVNNTFDTLLAVYTGSSINNLVIVGHNDEGSANPAFGGASTVDLMMTAGTTYYIAVDGVHFDGNTVHGNFKIVLLELDSPIQDNYTSSYNLGYGFQGSIAGTNFNATIEANEPTAYTVANPNGKSVWYRWKSNDNISIAFEVTDSFDSQIGIYTSNLGDVPPIDQLTKVTSNINYTGYTTGRYKTVFFAEANRTYLIKIDWHTFNNSQSPVGNFQLKYYPNLIRHGASFDYFGQKSSVGVFRPAEGVWYAIPYLDQPQAMIRYWGKNGDFPIAADFNGSGTSQLAALRNENGQKVWYIGNGGAVIKAIPWGLATDKPVVGDFDRDGRADLTAIRNSPNGYLWYVRQSRNESLRVFNWGTTGDKPVPGDFDGDGYTDVVVIRNGQNGLTWYQIRSGFQQTNLYTQTLAFQFGTAADLPAVADFDGDGKTDVAVFRPSTGTWYILRSSNGQLQVTPFGASGDKPQPGDYDGDGKADLALFRPSEGNWYFWMSGTNSQQVVHWGTSTDIPISSWNGLSQ